MVDHQGNMFDHHIPQEIVEEILHRLPAKSLVKLTSVCKAWNSLIKSQTFMTRHLNRTIEVSNGNAYATLFFQFYETKGIRTPKHLYSLCQVNQQSGNYSFPVETFPLSHLFRWDHETLFAGTCNGLVCCAKHRIVGFDLFDSHPPTLVIWNPLLRKYLLLPQPNANANYKKRKHDDRDGYATCFGFGFDSRNSDYKVIRVKSSLSKKHTYVDVYSLASRSWRNITVAKVPHFYFDEPYQSLPPIFLNGAVHWLAVRPDTPRLSKFILSFDVVKETFAELALPHQLKKHILMSLLSVEGGNSLALVNKQLRRRHDSFVYTIWVMKEYGVTESWTRVFCCTSDSYGGIASVLALTITGKVILSITGGDIILVDPITKSMETIGHQKISRKAFGGSYVESLFLINNQPDVLSCS